MPAHFDLHVRFEPRPSHQADLQRGFMAETADPAWFVGRQWQMGEHQGENAASPVLARVSYARRPLLESPGRPGQIPGHRPTESTPITPAEAIVEGEADDWWTVGRRIRIGRAAGAAVEAGIAGLPEIDQARFHLPQLPEPYAHFSTGYDGREIYLAFLAGTLALDAGLFAEVPGVQRDSHWEPAELKYGRVAFPADAAVPLDAPDAPRLLVCDHDGGEVEWWSAEADGDWSSPAPVELQTNGQKIQPARFSYPGAPHPRWWQIEDAKVDIGGFPPDRSHFASLLLLDLVLAHSDDWFMLALEAQVGDVLTVTDLVVVDLFGEEYAWSAYPQLQPPGDWSLFKIRNLGTDSLAVWPSVAVPVTGPPLEEIALGVDEDANLMWAVEERAEGLRLAALDPDPPADPAVLPYPDPEVSHAAGRLYRPSTNIPHHWHPYIIQAVNERRMFLQGRLVDYTPGEAGRLAPAPIAALLKDPAYVPGTPAHQVNPSVVPSTGLRLERRYILARRSDGQPVLWIQRQHLPLFSPPVSGLRFDVMKESSKS